MRTAEDLRARTLESRNEAASLFVEEIKRRFDTAADEAALTGKDFVCFRQVNGKDVPSEVIKIAVALLNEDLAFEEFLVEDGVVTAKHKLLISWGKQK